MDSIITLRDKPINLFRLYGSPRIAIDKMEINLIAHLIILMIVSIMICYILYSTFDTFSLFIAIVITGAIIVVNPKLFERIESQCAIQYYSVILIATLFFSIESCNTDHDLIMLLILTVGVTMISLYVGQKSILYLSVFLNSYLICRVGTIIWHRRNGW